MAQFLAFSPTINRDVPQRVYEPFEAVLNYLQLCSFSILTVAFFQTVIAGNVFLHLLAFTHSYWILGPKWLLIHEYLITLSYTVLFVCAYLILCLFIFHLYPS